MADGCLEVFRRTLLGRGFFMHIAPLRSRPGVVSIIWESLVSMRRCSREDFANNRSAQSLFIGASLSEPHTDQLYGSRVCIYICIVRLTGNLYLWPRKWLPFVNFWIIRHGKGLTSVYTNDKSANYLTTIQLTPNAPHKL